MTNTPRNARSRKRQWALSVVGLVIAAGLVVMPYWTGSPRPEKMPDLVRFLGHFHPVLLHLPIGVFALILTRELVAILGKRRAKGPDDSSFPIFFGAASAVVAGVAGFLLYHGEVEFKGSELVERHLWGGIAFAVAAIATWICKEWTTVARANPVFYRFMLFGSVGVMAFASHDGASVTHGEDYLTEYAPAPIRELLGPKKKPAVKSDSAITAEKPFHDRLLFADAVMPIFERRCIQCHKEGKAKGKFRMDSYELLMRGGKEGAGIVPGNASESHIVVRMSLPKTDEEHMPPEGKAEVEAHELAIIKWWIDQGADIKKPIDGPDVPESIRAAIALLPQVVAAIPDVELGRVTSGAPDDALREKVVKISKAFPGAISFESQLSDHVIFTAASLRGSFSDTDLKMIAPVGGHLVSLDLTGCQVTDQGVAQLAAAEKLKVIRLGETRVTNTCIETLLKMPNLESVNLYGTKVTDDGVVRLSGLPQLKRLYLWRTGVSDGAIQSLQKNLPSCEIIRGVSP